MSRHAPTSRNNEEANVFRHQFSTMSWSARSSPVQLHEACIFSKCFAVAMESVFVVKHGECLCGKTNGCLYLDPDSQSSKHDHIDLYLHASQQPICREMVKHHVHVHLCVWNCKVRCMLRHMCTCVYSILNHACKRALYFASCLAPPSATAANACEMLLASLRASLTLAEPSCEHICKFMNCNINMTIAGGWQHKMDDNSNTASGWQRWDWQWPGSTQSGWDWQWSGSSQASASGSTGTAAADEVQMEN